MCLVFVDRSWATLQLQHAQRTLMHPEVRPRVRLPLNPPLLTRLFYFPPTRTLGVVVSHGGGVLDALLVVYQSVHDRRFVETLRTVHGLPCIGCQFERRNHQCAPLDSHPSEFAKFVGQLRPL